MYIPPTTRFSSLANRCWECSVHAGNFLKSMHRINVPGSEIDKRGQTGMQSPQRPHLSHYSTGSSRTGTTLDLEWGSSLSPWGGTQWRGHPTLLAAGTPLVLNRLSGWPTLATTVPYNPGILATDPSSKGHMGIGHSISCGGRSWEPVCLVLGRWVKYRDVK